MSNLMTPGNGKQIPLENRLTPRILLINFDSRVCEQLQRLYSQCAYLVAVMRSGQGALEKIADGSTDLVVTDLRMPDRDGIEFIERIRETYSDVPVIVITGERDIELAVKALKLGVSDYIGMPFSADAVQESTR